MTRNLEHIALSSYESKSYSEVTHQEGFVSYGADNLFPQYLIDLYQSSPTHTALITSIAQMIYGEGFMPLDLDSRLAFDSWDMNDQLRKCCLDFKIQGGFALEVQWSLDRSRISNVSHLPFENLRACEVGEDEKVYQYKYSTDWKDDSVEVQTIHCFSPDYKDEWPTQVLYVKPFSPGSFYYPKPDYIGAINYVELEKEIGIYHINNIQNGLSPSFSIHFKNGIPPVEERNQIRNDIEAQMTGTKGAGKVWITYSDLPEQKPDFEPIPLSDADKQYQFLSEEVTSKIMIGHRVTNPMMFGVLVPGKLGGSTELEQSNQIFYDHVVDPMRKVVYESVVILLEASGLSSKMQFDKQKEEKTECSSHHVELDGAIDHLEEVGEDEDLEEWELIDSRPYNEATEGDHDALWEFASARVPSSNPSASSYQDSDLIKVRYTYAPKSVGNGATGKSRAFCSKMVSAGKVYRKEDIEAASKRAVNPGFGPYGSNTYDLFLFKGGPNCYHFWERRTYLKRNNSRISVNEARKMINKLPVDERADARIPTNAPRVARRPIDMPNQGYLKPR